MRFEEALSQMRQGNYVIACNTIYKLYFNNVMYWCSLDRKWKDTNNSLHEFMRFNFELGANPEQQDGLYKKGDEAYLKISTSKPWAAEVEFGFLKQEIRNKWSDSLVTFMELKSHRLAKKPTMQVYYAITCTMGGQLGVIRLERPEGDDYFKFPSILSPLFQTGDDAETAIKEIGSKRLIEMYMIFSGEY
jgi:hypothetical protein